jgi:hypothetical protein
MLVGLSLAACDGGARAPAPAQVIPPLPSLAYDPPPPLTLPQPCNELHAEDRLPTFEIEISDASWAALAEDIVQGEEVYYPIVFRLGDEVADAMMRLRGNNSRCGEKLQFAISFDEGRPGGRFHGLRRLDLDHGGCGVLEERLALAYLRDLGLPAACANHARLVVNGVYYGLFTNIEHVNKDFLGRHFGPDGNDGYLYKSGWSLRGDEPAGGISRLGELRSATDAAAVVALADLDEAVLEWAAEAVLPARDNYWLVGHNYYLYEHPQRGFLFVPTDFDQAFPITSVEARLPSLVPDELQHPASVVLLDPAWSVRYEESVRRAVAAYDADAFEGRIWRWWAQIAIATAEDPHLAVGKPHVEALVARIRLRDAWLDEAVGAPASW